MLKLKTKLTSKLRNVFVPRIVQIKESFMPSYVKIVY